MKESGTYFTLEGKPKMKRKLGRSVCRWEDNIKVSLEMYLEGVVWIYLCQNRNQLLITMDTIMKCRVL
jgi:hypothetical protein